jgi:splicing factor 3B subunit 1
LLIRSMILDEEIKKAQAMREAAKVQKGSSAYQRPDKASLVGAISYDQDVYDAGADFDKYETALPMMDEDNDDYAASASSSKRLASYTAPKEVYRDIAAMEEDAPDPMEGIQKNSRRIADREDAYRKQRLNRELSPERVDAFAAATGSTSDADPEKARSYSEVFRQAEVDKEYQKTLQKVAEKKKEMEEKGEQLPPPPTMPASSGRRRRWDQGDDVAQSAPEEQQQPTKKSEWEEEDEPPKKEDAVVPKRSRWDDATPVQGEAGGRKRNRWDETPVATSASSAWDATPKAGVAQTPTGKRSRWDETPVASNMAFAATPVGAAGLGMMTPTPGQIPIPMTPEAVNAARWEKELDVRNRYMTDEEIDSILPSEGYKIVEPPASYVPIRTPARKLMATPTPIPGQMGAGFMMQEEVPSALAGGAQAGYDVPPEIAGVGQLQFFKPEDMQHFAKLMDNKNEDELSIEELKERKIMRLLLKIKNGAPPVRKAALRQITDKAREFGAGPLFNQILPLLMSPTLEDQERHLLVRSC